jgi:hypothetical protein
MLLTATPAAAHGLGYYLGFGDNKMNVEAKADLDSRFELHHDKRNGSGSTLNNAEVQAKVQAKTKARLSEFIKNSVNSFARFTKKVCGASSTDQTVVNACIEKAKVDLKASVNVMIDAAFKA